jgi:hypothetical protein
MWAQAAGRIGVFLVYGIVGCASEMCIAADPYPEDHLCFACP